jgi:hypothetical protein
MPPLSQDHPTQELSFAVASSDAPRAITSGEMEALIEKIRSVRPWVVRPPEYVDSACILWLYSAHPPWGDKLPVEIDRANLDEASFVVGYFEELSARTGYRIVVALDGTELGEIAGGRADTSISEAFLGKWERTLSARENIDVALACMYPHFIAETFHLKGSLVGKVRGRPEVVTFGEWETIVARMCDGIRTVRDIVERVVADYEGSAEGLSKIALLVIQALAKAGVVELREVRLPSPAEA